MKPSQITILMIIIAVAWASLFVTNIVEGNRTSKSLSNETTILSNDTRIIQEQRATINILSGKISDLQAHDDCLFNLATQPNPGASHITNSSPCEISANASGQQAPSGSHSMQTTAPDPKPTTAPQNSSPSSTPQPASPSNQPTPTPQPAPIPLLCTVTLHLLGC